MPLDEIILPITEPETEWVRGRALQKSSPTWNHGRPDVGYLTHERANGLGDADLQLPRLAPDVAIEILSPGDRRNDVDDKIATYLRAGTQFVVDDYFSSALARR